jgi:hypothetical protein
MRGLPGATLANIDVVGSLILNTTSRGVTDMGRDQGQVPRLPSALASWFTPSQALTRTTGMAVALRRGWQYRRATPRYRLLARPRRLHRLIVGVRADRQRDSRGADDH